MSFLSRMLKQCRKPTGWLGEWTALKMNSGHAKLTAWGLSHLIIQKDDVILDVGCGGGATITRLAHSASEGKVYGIDFSDTSVKVAQKTNRELIEAGRVEVKQGSVSALPFTDNTFNLVTAVETYYFWPDLIADMREVKRVLKPGGSLAIIAEAYNGGKYDKRNRKWIEEGNMACHSVKEMGELIYEAGYVQVQVYEEYQQGWICGIGMKAV
jgi:SAM-dependent methyltransferase